MKQIDDHAKHATEHRSIMARFGTMNLILVIIGVTLLVFTVSMIHLFKVYGAIPDTLVTCVFATLGGECGVMGWIKTSKDRIKERTMELQDREYYERKLNSTSQPESLEDSHDIHEDEGGI